MSRSGYTDYYDYDEDSILAQGRWRAQVKNSTRGKRGQTLLRGILAAMDAMPEKKIYPNVLVNDGRHDVIVGADDLTDKRGNPLPMGAVCAMGAYAKAKGIDTSDIDPEDTPQVAALFDVAEPLVREIAFMNDEGSCGIETPEKRFIRMRRWIESQIKEEVKDGT